MPGAKNPRLIWPILITTVLYIGSATRAPTLPDGLSFTGYDKVGHFCVYGMLAVAWLRALTLSKVIEMRHLILAALIASVSGVVDEFIQYFNPARTYDYADMLMDVIGSCAGVTVFHKATGLRCLLEKKPFALKKTTSESSAQ